MHLTVRPLDAQERRLVYETRYAKDFHPIECKPTSMIERMLAEKRYDCLGFFDGTHLAAYAFLMPTDVGVILDYFAVDHDFRGTGIGSEVLRLLHGALDPALPLLIETEDPAYAPDAADLANRERRIRFYERSGFRLTGVHILLFGSRYLLMVLGGEDCGDEALLPLLREAYLRSMGREIYENHITLSL